jgi:hypothetical protein
MTLEYKQMREALIALLCVGDKIPRIHKMPGKYHRDTNTHDYYYHIKYSTVVEITENDINLLTSKTIHLGALKWIEAYEGELYFWGEISAFSPPRRDNKIKEMIKIIESKATLRDPRI